MAKSNLNKFMSRVAIFGAVAAILYIVPFLQFSVPFLPGFLEFHFDELPIFIAGFAFGPLEAFCIIVLKTILKLPFTSTVCTGELADFIYSCAFILPSAILYKNKRTLKTAIMGVLIGFVLQIIVSTLCNVYFMIDLYSFLYGMSPSDILAWVQVANPRITNIHWSLAIWGIIPFNLIKDLIVIIITFLVYKKVEVLFKKGAK